MCGRYQFSSDRADDNMLAIVRMMDRNYPGAYKTGEIFPGDTAPAVVEKHGKIIAVPAVFGFPGFQNNRLLINARSETAAEKRTFSDSLKYRRMIIPASGFYEWGKESTGRKQKYLFTVDAQQAIYLCAIYRVIEGQYCFVILTREANESMIETHDRMPVIVKDFEVRSYLTDTDAAMQMITTSAPMLNRQTA